MMPGLTLNTEAAASRVASQQRHPSPANRGSVSGQSASNPPPPRPLHSTTPIPVPVPMPYVSREQPPQPQPQPSPRSASPVRPTYSPITPPLNATTLPPRPAYTHSSHADATAVPAPAPEPIDFDSNPDVLALKSAISILQMQRKKAERDMATLGRVKGAALAEPETFVRDLATGRVRVEGEGLFAGGVREGKESGSSSEGESDSENESEGDDDGQPQGETREAETTNVKPDPDAKMSEPPPWAAIPKPQNIVRCPPINWSQYAVVGESLDKLHNEQVQRPVQGTPAVLTPDGRFEFKGGDGAGIGKQERYMGVAAPYAPGKDKLDAKPKIPPKR
ncbi:hypothetical protein F5Y10DRAFT_16726 [Nemania abortiva]|nr:hypothetical protein F5Y10DRAFT_16726 [Nemania abortiva]